MANRKIEILGLFLGGVAGAFAYSWYKESKLPKDNKEVDTGTKTKDGKSIVEVTGVGGTDNGVKIQGYTLPSKIDSIVFPLTVVVKPNKNLFLHFKVGDKVTFTGKIGDELRWMGDAGSGAVGEYVVWLPNLIESALGDISSASKGGKEKEK